MYSFLRKKVNVDADLGLLMESLYITPIAIVAFYIISLNGNNYFSTSDPLVSFWLFLAGPMTVIPLFLFLRAVPMFLFLPF